MNALEKIQYQRDLQVKIAKRIVANVPGTKPMVALAIADEIVRGQ